MSYAVSYTLPISRYMSARKSPEVGLQAARAPRPAAALSQQEIESDYVLVWLHSRKGRDGAYNWSFAKVLIG